MLFQSTPAITGGRDQQGFVAGTGGAGFNPRPPLLAGETESSRNARRGYAVSIHARHYWRARRERPPASQNCESFQSTPAITGGRDGKRRQERTGTMVSIHARHYWRARQFF